MNIYQRMARRVKRRVVSFVLESKGRIDIALGRGAGAGDVRRGSMVCVRRQTIHRASRTVYTARIVIGVRKLRTLQHPVTGKIRQAYTC